MNAAFLYASLLALGAVCGLATALWLLPRYERRTKRKNATKRRLASRAANRQLAASQLAASRLANAKLMEGESGNAD